MWQTAWGCCSYTSSGVSVRGTVAEKKNRAQFYLQEAGLHQTRSIRVRATENLTVDMN